MKSIAVLVSIAAFFSVVIVWADSPAAVVKPSDNHIQYVGRWDVRDPAGPRCEWSASEVRVAFVGPEIDAQLSDTGPSDQFEVVVDGTPAANIKVAQGTSSVVLASGLSPSRHVVALVKLTEAFVGAAQILGFSFPDGGHVASAPKAPTRQIEVVGDSISCGYGDEAPNQNVRFTPDTENAYLAYGDVAARLLDADYTCVAWSGRKMWPDNTTPEIYDLALPTDTASAWNFRGWHPQVVLINLATNDFGKGNPDETGWTTAYEAFITRLRTHYPHAWIYCASGPMMSDDYPAGQKALTTLYTYLDKIVSDEHARGDNRVSVIHFPPQDPKNGFGADWHPSLKTHALMGAQLADQIKSDLGW